MKRMITLLLTLSLCVCLCACGKSSEAKKADELILAIGEVSLDSKNAIQDAQSYYDTLTEEQKSEVENYPVLQSASETLESLERVAAVEESINMIGTVTVDSEPLITAAQTAFDALSEEEKNMVSKDNRDTLANAQLTFVDIASSMHWEVVHYVDDFGDETEDAYIRGIFTGTFSNTATTNEDLTVVINYDYYIPEVQTNRDPATYTMSFRLLEYNDHMAVFTTGEEITLKVKINDRVVEYNLAGIAPNGDLFVVEKGAPSYLELPILTNALKENEYTISCVILIGSSKYSFEIDGTGFMEQIDNLNSVKGYK